MIFNISASKYGAQPGKDATTAIKTARADLIAYGGGSLYIPFSVGCNYSWVQTENEILFADDRSTSITWLSDLGASAMAIVTGPNASTHGYSGIRDITLIGPGNQNAPLGTSPCQMLGPIFGSKGWAERVNVAGFHTGFAFSGDHQRIQACSAWSNYYNAAWYPGISSGNQRVMSCDFASPKMAGFGIHGDTSIDTCVLLDNHLYGGPYGILKENSGNYSQDILVNSVCGLWFEALGNGAIFDQGHRKTVGFNRFLSLAASWQPGSRLASAPADWTVSCGSWLRNSVDGNGNGIAAGAVGVFNTNAFEA